MRTVAVWTPSSPAPALFPRRTARAMAALERLGWTAVPAATMYGRSRASAATPSELAKDLHAMVGSGGVDAVLAASGGWSASLALPHLDFGLLRAAGVPLIGYSDVSVLLWAFVAHGVPAVHGPMLVSEFGHFGGPFAETVGGLEKALEGGGELRPPREWTADDPWWDRDDERLLEMRPAAPWRVLRHGSASGPLLAGCLPAVAGLFGTPYLPDTRGRVLFLEDCGIAPDRFLFLLAQWRNSGLLDEVAGLVLGRRPRAEAAPGGYDDFDDAVLHVLDGTAMPVVADVDFGHTEPMISLVLGARARVETDPLSLRTGEPHA